MNRELERELQSFVGRNVLCLASDIVRELDELALKSGESWFANSLDSDEVSKSLSELH